MEMERGRYKGEQLLVGFTCGNFGPCGARVVLTPNEIVGLHCRD